MRRRSMIAGERERETFWMVIGIVLYFALRASNPGALARLGEIYGGETPPPET